MSSMNARKYRPYAPVDLPERRWPGKVIERPPIWCSVDLRDGNQALIEPMGPERKLRLFELLIRMGFKEIEVGFPSASQTEYDFLRRLVEEERIPEDVTVQVLTQSREDLIRRTFEALRGVRRAIVHLYNSTSTLQRRVVFGMDRAGIVDIAVRGTRLIQELSATAPGTEVVLEYSPESFTGTELDFALEICEAVIDTWGPTPERKMILNLPATVEMATPNVYADQVEWMSDRLRRREAVLLSVHPHNDRGTAVAAAELAMMAGADRVEGTLFGNGERTGNVDVVTLALNMYTQGIDPGLSIGDVNAIAQVVEHCNRLPIHPRHPYVGDLVFTAFSGSHQDAIKKGLAALRQSGQEVWEVPYLPIDPGDLGRSYEAIIRINSQSGKGGIAYVLEEDYGLRLPRRLQIEFSRCIQRLADASGLELTSEQIWEAFREEYLSETGRFALLEHRTFPVDGPGDGPGEGERYRVEARVRDGEEVRVLEGEGNGPIDAFVSALNAATGLGLRISDYAEHAVSKGADARAAAYVEATGEDGRSAFGVALHGNIVIASVRAVLSAASRLYGERVERRAAE